jgi:hypothetical protein
MADVSALQAVQHGIEGTFDRAPTYPLPSCASVCSYSRYLGDQNYTSPLTGPSSIGTQDGHSRSRPLSYVTGSGAGGR